MRFGSVRLLQLSNQGRVATRCPTQDRIEKTEFAAGDLVHIYREMRQTKGKKFSRTWLGLVSSLGVKVTTTLWHVVVDVF